MSEAAQRVAEELHAKTLTPNEISRIPHGFAATYRRISEAYHQANSAMPAYITACNVLDQALRDVVAACRQELSADPIPFMKKEWRTSNEEGPSIA
jgi:hypothetical protein